MGDGFREFGSTLSLVVRCAWSYGADAFDSLHSLISRALSALEEEADLGPFPFLSSFLI